MTETWIIVGASSAMARALARATAPRSATLLLCGRDTEDLQRDAADLRLRGAQAVEVLAYDTRDPGTEAALVARAAALEGPFNVAVFAGAMPPQTEVEADPSLLAGVVQDNFTATGTLLLRLAPLMEARGAGTVVGVASVAGDRGRLGNHVYGAAKAGFATLLSGLRNRLGRSGVHVVTVKPGFVDTAMTWGLDGMFLVAAPEAVAKDILAAVRRRRNVVYTPWFWAGIMAIIRSVPEPIFKKLQI
ncbi:SDR family oxidoreductase [Rhodobacteraceae bacterium 2CG4]|uniref:SDR family oxidoreductase n=1 Tax=Halovulum marinum TaxID=2662447 RepID=A0A6L5YVK6_9RHOB|nr:SDR family oxidoreductase [Halovulum marinum]MSU88383.1 SDR family oxidoreductase [Halovulum marinum]